MSRHREVPTHFRFVICGKSANKFAFLRIISYLCSINWFTLSE